MAMTWALAIFIHGQSPTYVYVQSLAACSVMAADTIPHLQPDAYVTCYDLLVGAEMYPKDLIDKRKEDDARRARKEAK